MPFKTKPKDFTPVFAQALGLSEGDKIEEISGTLTNIFPMKQAGKTTVQNGELETEHGKIKINVWGTELPKNLKGKAIKILSTNKKFGEIEYKINEYDGKNGHVTEETLSIGNNADIEEDNGNEATQKPSPAGSVKQDSKVVYEGQGFSLLDSAESLVAQHIAVHDMVHAGYYKKNLTPETLQAYVATIWIALDRAGKIVIGQPIGEAPQSRQDARSDLGKRNEGQPPKEAPKAQGGDYIPQNWAEAKVPSGKFAGKMLVEVGKPAILAFEEYRLQKGYDTGFWACVKQAATDLEFNPDTEEDNIPF